MGEVCKINQRRPDARVFIRTLEVLLDGGVVVMPTDSVYGIGCAATEGCPGHERIFGIKRRARSQTLPWLISDVDDIWLYAREIPGWALDLADAFWPGALTLVVEASRRVPAEYVAADGTIALRVPDSALVRMLARLAGPLATTSANTHGVEAATDGADIEPRIIKEADLTLDAGPAPLAIASTIVDCANGLPNVLREGAISREEILYVADV